MKRPAVVIVATLLGLAAMWGWLLRPPATAPQQLVMAPSPTTTSTSLSISDPSAVVRRVAATVGPRTAPDQHPGVRPVATSTTSGTPAGRRVVPTVGPSTAPARPPAVRRVVTPTTSHTPSPTTTPARQPAPYVFAPRATASGPAPTSDFKLSDLSLHAGQVLTWDVTMSSPGALLFDAHTASSSATAGAYPVAALYACVEYVGQAPCTPVATPQPAYWAVMAADLAHHDAYRVRVLAMANSSLLAGIRVGWRGPDSVTFAGAVLPGGCRASVGSGYVAGCGLKFKIVTKAATPLTVTTATRGLQISLKNTVTNAKVYSGPLTSPQTMQVPSAGEWSGHLYPSNGSRVPSLTLTLTWK